MENEELTTISPANYKKAINVIRKDIHTNAQLAIDFAIILMKKR